MNPVLQVDVTGTPQEWISAENAASLIYADHIAWSAGPIARVLTGGVSRMTGLVSTIEVPAIIATRGTSRINLADMVPTLGRYNAKLFMRDRHMCAYCAQVYPYSNLTRDHIVPLSKGGKDTWTNVVAACCSCNHRKGARTPEQFGHQLVYLPYAPNWFEDFILQRGGRRILADQMDFLMARVSPHSRLHVQ